MTKNRECSYGAGVDCALAPLHYHKGEYDDCNCYNCGKPFTLIGEELFWNRDGHLQPFSHMTCHNERGRQGFVSRGGYGVMTESGPKYIGFDNSQAVRNATLEAHMLEKKRND